MAIYLSELKNSTEEELFELISAYYVKPKRAEKLSSRNAVIDWINAWLTPENSTTFTDDRSSVDPEIFSAITDNELTSVEELRKWPMRKVWGNYEPLDLLTGYMKSRNKVNYFEQITGEPYLNFLSDKERVFFLTRGYGRPNRFISPYDLQLRRFYIFSEPTALVALMDTLKICPNKQEPDLILNVLSDKNLRSITSKYNDVISEVNRIFLEEDSVDKFKEFLNSKGILDDLVYDPRTNVHRSNLAQLELYKDVDPNYVFDMDEVRGLPDPFILITLHRLPDKELMKITDTETPEFRSVLFRYSCRFLTKKRHIMLDDDTVGYGRFVDIGNSSMLTMTKHELLDSIESYNAYIDKYGNVIDPKSPVLSSMSSLDPLHNQMEELARLNALYMAKLTPEQRGTLAGAFDRLVREGIDMDELVKVIDEHEFAKELSLYDQFPLGITFKIYFRFWKGTLLPIIRSTLIYYSQVLTN